MYLSTIYHALRFCGSQAKTLFLFTKSDIKTTIFPVSFFAVASAPLASITRLPHVIFWIWLHLLMFNLSNQTQDPDEDMHNKPDRPLPSRRITYANAIVLRWLMLPVCWLVSLAYSTSVLQASVALSIFTFIYNELHGHSGHFVVKNVLNGTGFASFELGATLVAGSDPACVDSTAILAICLSAGIFATTIQIQDFRDEQGDRLIGRHTLPILFPRIARPTFSAALLCWTFYLIQIWSIDTVTGIIFFGLAIFTGGRLMVKRHSAADDEVTYSWYNVWLSLAHALPGFWRFYHKDAFLSNVYRGRPM